MPKSARAQHKREHGCQIKIASCCRKGIEQLFVLILLLVLPGCPPKKAEEQIGEPIALAQALAQYNRNVLEVPAFRAAIREWEILYNDPRTGETHRWRDRLGQLYYRPPKNTGDRATFCLRAGILLPPESEALVVAANPREFWLYSKVIKFGAWGTYDDHTRVLNNRLPISPHAFLDCMGLALIPSDPNITPYPCYQVSPERRIIEYSSSRAGEISSRHKIVIDRHSSLPREISQYNNNGRCILHTTLGDYQRLANAMLPSNIKIQDPLSGSYFRLKLGNFKVDNKNRERLFSRPQTIAGLRQYKNIGHVFPNDTKTSPD